MTRVPIALLVCLSVLATSGEAPARRHNSRCVLKNPPADDGVLLSTFTTRFSARAHKRASNVRRAGLRLDGAEIPRGGALSYNHLVGPRDARSGFLPAPAIDRGRLVDKTGGGACQPSSTLHAAALFAGLGVEERSEHTLLSAYIGAGLDASVVYGLKDLVLKNPYPFPIRLAAEVGERHFSVRILGQRGRRGWVEIQTRPVKRRRHKVVIEVDPNLNSKDYLVDVFGMDGLRVARKRLWKDRRGRVVRLERLADDFYYPRDEVVRVGPDRSSARAAPTAD